MDSAEACFVVGSGCLNVLDPELSSVEVPHDFVMNSHSGRHGDMS